MPHRPLCKWHHWYLQPLGTPSASGRCTQPPAQPIPSNGLWPPSREASLTWHHRVCWLEGTQQDHQGWPCSAPSPAIPPCGWEPYPNTSWALPGWCCHHCPGELFWVKCLFLTPNLNLPWHSFRPFPPDLSLLMREKRWELPLRRML